MAKTDISIIITSYNRRLWLEEAIKSCRAIRNKSNFSVQIIVIDDGSSEETLSFLKNQNDIILLHQKNRGANVARNTGMRIAEGEYIKFLDDDDFLDTQGVIKQIQNAQETGAKVSYGDIFLLEQTQKTQNKIFIKKEAIENPLAELLSNWSNMLFSYLFHRSILESITWNEELTGYQDFDFALKVAEKNNNFNYLPEIIGFCRIHNQPSTMKRSPLERVYNRIQILDSSFSRLSLENKITPVIKKAYAQGYYNSIRVLFRKDKNLFNQVKDRIYQLDPEFVPGKYYNKRDSYGVMILGITGWERVLKFRRSFMDVFEKFK